jgi:hypothetical protein
MPGTDIENKSERLRTVNMWALVSWLLVVIRVKPAGRRNTGI